MKKIDVEMPWEINPHVLAILPCDAYKLSHRLMYPDDTTNLYSVFYARKKTTKFQTIAWNHKFGKKIILYIVDKFANSVKELSKETKKNDPITKLLLEKITTVFGFKEFSENFINCLKKIGQYIFQNNRLPITVSARKSDESTPFEKPLITITGRNNIDVSAVWLINYFETIILENIWQFTTSLTIARDYYFLVKDMANKTCDDSAFIKYQCHDFSMRGMSSITSAIYSANAHLHYFNGSDTIIGGNNAQSVLASEHSVMCADGKENEFKTYERLIKKFPKGILSLVSDSWDLWKVMDEYLPKLKDKIIKRDGRLVIRPDSGDPIEIICGSKNFSWNNKKTWGVIHYLDHHFGSTWNSKKYKVLNPKVGIIYGDAITYERTKMILENLQKQKYASSNIVFGVGASTYQAVTRDTLGFVAKTTALQRKKPHGKKEWINIEKDPTTDHEKKSITGRFLNDPDLIKIY